MNSISVIPLGTVDYATALRLQQKLVELRKAGQIGDVLLLLEHPPVITLGRNAKSSNILAAPELLQHRGVEVFECDRGGDVTFHGPGQIVGYPIFNLRDFTTPEGERKTLGAVDYVRKVEEALIRTCAEFAIPTVRIPGLTGVWTEKVSGAIEEADLCEANVGTGALARPCEPQARLSSNTAKIAAIGVHISRAVTSHGFALNVNTDLSYFNLIVPCGIESKPVTSMSRELGRELDLNKVAQALTRNFGFVFGRQILWLETLDALLGHTIGVPMKPPAELRQLHSEDDIYLA
jgi:lipoyl(octanoyl) transferase